MWIVAAAAALALAPGATQNPDWVSRPTGDQLAEVYPERAIREDVGGTATIRCVVKSTGELTGCKVTQESPADYGFGEAALKLAPTFKMSPAVRRGKPTDGVVTIPIRFAGPDPKELLPGTGAIAIRPLEWVERPDASEVQAAFPKAAREADVQGVVELSCVITSEGRLETCRVTAENPSELGFGAAALSLASRFKAPATTSDGAPTAGVRVYAPLVFPVEKPKSAGASATGPSPEAPPTPPKPSL